MQLMCEVEESTVHDFMDTYHQYSTKFISLYSFISNLFLQCHIYTEITSDKLPMRIGRFTRYKKAQLYST